MTDDDISVESLASSFLFRLSFGGADRRMKKLFKRLCPGGIRNPDPYLVAGIAYRVAAHKAGYDINDPAIIAAADKFGQKRADSYWAGFYEGWSQIGEDVEPK